jgi:hypothetical protein
MNDPKDVQLVMGWLATGNSAYDILKLLVESIQTTDEAWLEMVKEVKEAVAELKTEGLDPELYYISAYDQLAQTANKVVVE